MQQLGYFKDEDGNIIKVLQRRTKYGTTLKIRKSGKDGCHIAEQDYLLLPECKHLLEDLKSGKVIYC